VAATMSPSSAHVNVTLEKLLGYKVYPPPPISFCVFPFIIYCTDFYLFVLCSGLIISSSFSLSLSFIPQLCSFVSLLCTWYFYHGVAVGYNFYPSAVVLFWIYLFINHIFHSVSCPFSHFACVDVLLHLATAPVVISSLIEHLSSELHWLLHSPLPLNHMHQP